MRSRLARGLLFLGVLLGLLGLVELVVRVRVGDLDQAGFTPVPASIRRASSLPGVPFLLAPGAQAVHAFGSDPRGYFDPGATLTYRTNALGLRGPETSRRKPAGSFRIVGLGDSFTFGTGVRQHDTFLALLERRLAQAGRQPPVEVLNLGVMAYDTRAEVALLEHLGLALEPDLVVLVVFLNDAGGGTSPARAARAPRSWWRRQLKTWDLIATRRELRETAGSVLRSYADSFRDDAPGWIEARQALRHARELSRAHDFELALVIFPVLWELAERPLAPAHRAIADFGRELGLEVLDLYPAFAQHDGPELWVHPSNRHPNELAHAVAAEALQRFLSERGLLDRPAAR